MNPLGSNKLWVIVLVSAATLAIWLGTESPRALQTSALLVHANPDVAMPGALHDAAWREPLRDEVESARFVSPDEAVERATWTGRAEVRTSTGVIRDLDGELILLVDAGAGARRIHVPVRGGNWTLERPNADEVQFGTLTLGGKRVDLPSIRLVVPDGDQPTLLAGGWAESTLLTVVDAADGRAIAGIEVRSPSGSDRAECGVPSQQTLDDMPLATGDSPLELAGLTDTRTVWIGAPRYAWKRVVVDPFRGGERYVALQQSGIVTFRFTDLPADERAFLRIYPALACQKNRIDMWPGLTKSAARYEVRARAGIDATLTLPNGTWFARLENSLAVTPAPRSALRRFEVVAGTEVAVELPYRFENAPPKDVSLRVIVTLPPETPLVEGVMLLRRTAGPCGGEAATMELPSDRWEYATVRGRRAAIGRFEGLRRGDVRLLVVPWQLSRTLELRGPGEETVEFEVPRLCAVTLRVLDPHDRERMEIRSARWGLGRKSSQPPGRSTKVDAAPGSRELHLALPPGQFTLQVSLAGGSSMSRRVDIGQDDVLVEWIYEPDAAVDIRFQDDGRTVLLDSESWDAVELLAMGEPVDGQRRSFTSAGSSSASFTQRIAVLAPGPYELRMPRIDGYEPLPDVPVTLVAGRVVEAQIELRRRSNR